MTLNFEDINQVHNYKQIPHKNLIVKQLYTTKQSCDSTRVHTTLPQTIGIRECNRLSTSISCRYTTNKTNQTNIQYFNKRYYEYSFYSLEKPHNLCASEVASIVVFKIATPIATQLNIHCNNGSEEIQRLGDHTRWIDLAYIAANFGKNRLSLLLLNILTTDRPAELHFELNRGSGLCHRMRNANFLLG